MMYHLKGFPFGELHSQNSQVKKWIKKKKLFAKAFFNQIQELTDQNQNRSAEFFVESLR